MKPHFYITCILCFISPLICAQVPFEYFQIESISPPVSEIDDVLPQQPSLPTQLALDADTKAAGDLSLTEPFAPPVGTYKRRMVFSQIRDTGNAANHRFSIHPDNIHCVQYTVHNAPESHAFHRSALVNLQAQANQMNDIPSDSPEMVISDFRITPIRTDGQLIAPILYRCSDDRYAVLTPTAGLYRIEYETASLPDSGKPKTADFFNQFVQNNNSSLLEQRQIQDIQNIISSSDKVDELNNIYPDISKLIRYFQNYESAPLDGADSHSTDFGDELFAQILRQKKGLCRHRAFAFVLIAALWGYQARIVINEVHAFVEVLYHERWYPIELGGLANSLTITSTSPSKPLIRQQQFEFLSQNTPDDNQQAINISVSGDRSISNHEMSSLSIRMANKLIFRPVNGFPMHLQRSVPLTLEGLLEDNKGALVTDKPVVLQISTLDEKQKHRIYFHTDDDGSFKLEMRLPENWPLGRTSADFYLAR